MGDWRLLLPAMSSSTKTLVVGNKAATYQANWEGEEARACKAGQLSLKDQLSQISRTLIFLRPSSGTSVQTCSVRSLDKFGGM